MHQCASLQSSRVRSTATCCALTRIFVGPPKCPFCYRRAAPHTKKYGTHWRVWISARRPTVTCTQRPPRSYELCIQHVRQSCAMRIFGKKSPHSEPSCGDVSTTLILSSVCVCVLLRVQRTTTVALLAVCVSLSSGEIERFQNTATTVDDSKYTQLKHTFSQLGYVDGPLPRSSFTRSCCRSSAPQGHARTRGPENV